jgi:hypothetical protein
MDYWKEVPNMNSIYNFKWQPVSKGIHFAQLSLQQKQRQLVNHFEFHGELTTKDGLFRNLLAHAQTLKQDVFDFVPLTFIIEYDGPRYNPDFEKFLLCYDTIGSVPYPGSQLGTQPSDCSEVLRQINAKLKQVTFSKDKRGGTNCKAKLMDTHFAGKNLWVLKPTGFNRGRGVSVFDTVEKLRALLKEYAEGVPDEGVVGVSPEPSSTKEPAEPRIPDGGDWNHPCISNLNNLPSLIKSKTFVVQKYIERPLLIHGRKFDVRVWVLLTHELKLFFFKEGYIRTSSTAFTMDSEAIDKRDVHLTNNAVQKFCHNYGLFEDGNQLSFGQLQVGVSGTL